MIPPEPAPRHPTSFAPSPFPLANQFPGAPNGWDEAKHGPCDVLPVWAGYNSSGLPVRVSKWKLASLRERIRILITGEVWLTIVWPGQIPVSLNSEIPITIKHVPETD